MGEGGGGCGWCGAGGGRFHPLSPHFLEALAFLIKRVPALLRKSPGKLCPAEGVPCGAGGLPPPPCARREPGCRGRVWAGRVGCSPEPTSARPSSQQERGTEPAAELPTDRIHPWPGGGGAGGWGGGYFASPPARGGGALPALAPGFLTSPEAETCELMTGMARRTKGDAAPGGPAKTQPWGWTGGKIWAKSKARGWGQEQTQLRVPGQDGGGSAVAPAVSVARCVPRHRGSGMQRAVFAVERARTACIGRR